MSTLKLYILFAVICLSSGQMQLIVNGVPQSASDEYDVPTGSNLQFTCANTNQEPICDTPTPIYARNPRFEEVTDNDIVRRLSRTTTNNSCVLTLTDVKYYDTGYLTCNDESIYIFVNDQNPQHVLYPVAGDHTIIYFKQNEPVVIPCHPTRSDASVELLGSLGGASYNSKIGFTFARPTLSFMGAVVRCVSGTATEYFNLEKAADLARPLVRSLNSTSHYIAGTTLQLECSVAAKTATLTWRYPSKGDNSKDVNVNPIRRQPSVIVSEFTLRQLTVDDYGMYTCVNVGRFNQSEEKGFSIQVYEKPFLELSTSQTSPQLGELHGNITFHVNIRGYPPPRISWSKDGGDRITTNDKFAFQDIALDRGATRFMTKLVIKMLATTDKGNYTVTAENGAFEKMSFILRVQVAPTHTVDLFYDGEFVTASSNNFFTPGKMLKLTCRTTGGEPQPQISWEYQYCSNQCNQTSNWLLVSEDDPVTGAYISESGVKSQTVSLKLASSVWFRCTTSNPVDSKETPIQVKVSEVTGGVGFPDDISDITYDVVETYPLSLPCYSFKFQCNIDKMRILKKSEQNGSLVLKSSYTKSSPGVRVESTLNSDILRLEIESLSMDMNGTQYICECDMMQGSTTKLNVQGYEPASFALVTRDDVIMEEGETKMFACVPKGRPLPTVNWFWNDQQINNNNQLIQDKRYIFSDNNHNLTIDRVKQEESGMYKCIVSTDRHNDSAVFELTVVGTGLTGWQIALIVIIILIFCIAIGVVTIICTRKYCRKKYIPSGLLLPSKAMINPDIPLDEQTDALPYDVGWEFPYDKLKMGQLLGQGAFGRVLKAEAFGIEEGVAVTTVAVKTTRDSSDIEQVKALISELKILIHIGQHLNIVNLLGACTKNMNKGLLMVIVEYCRYGNLRAYLLKHKSHFNPTLEETSNPQKFSVQITGGTDMQDDYLNEGPSELHNEERPISLRDLVCWSYQIARGMEYLASIDYIHRDLAARNVLLGDDNLVKICDFGLAKDIYKYQEYQKKTDGPLPIKWMALESLTHKVFNTTTDVWSYGVTLWELFSIAATPYPGVELDETFIDKLEAGYRMDKPKNAPSDIYTVMLQTWHPDADKRPTFQELSDIMGEMLSEHELKHLTGLEDPYIRTRDSRTDITIRQPSARRRRLSEFDSNYLRTSQLRKPNGSPGDYVNTIDRNHPTTSQPNQAKNWDKTDGTIDEKLPLQVAIDDDSDMPTNVAPSPSPWERQSHLGKAALRSEDTHSTHSGESDGHRPPSYNYVMKKKDDGAHPSNLRMDVEHEEADSETKPFIETSC